MTDRDSMNPNSKKQKTTPQKIDKEVTTPQKTDKEVTTPQKTDKEVIPDNQVYMVFTYNTGLSYVNKCVRGVYLTPVEAADRQKELIPNGEFGINGSRCGRDRYGRSACAFTNVFPLGSGDTPLHSTSVSNWQKYI
jgi:hypothetical protein